LTVSRIAWATRLTLGVWGLSLGCVLALVALTALQLRASYNRTIEIAGAHLADTARITEEQVRGSLRVIRLMLKGFVEAPRTDTATLRDLMQTRIATIPEIRQAFFVNPDGQVTVSTLRQIEGWQVQHRPYFSGAKDLPAGQDLYFSKPLEVGTDKAKITFASMPLFDAAGRFQGIVAVSLQPAYFQRLLETVHSGEEGAGALVVTAEGDIIGRDPDPVQYVAKNISKGGAFALHREAKATASVLTHFTVTDGKEKVSAVRTLIDPTLPPLVVIVGRPLDGILAPWRAEATTHSLVVAALALAVLGLTALTWRHAKILRSGEHYRRSLLDSFPFMVWMKDEQGRFLAVNQAFATGFGWPSSDSLIGRTDFDIAPRELAEGYRADDKAVLASGCSKQVEELIESDGQRQWFETYKSPILADGHLIGTIGFARNITERKQVELTLERSEAQYRSLFENMQGGFAYHKVIYDGDRPVDFSYVAVNSNFEILTGLKNVVGKKISEIIPGLGESDPDLFDRYFTVARTGRAERFEKYIDVLNMWFSISVFSTDPDHFAVVFDNISDRIEAQNAILKNTELLKQSNADLEQFAYVASHDLQTPLRNIVSYAQLLQHRYGGKIDSDADIFIDFIVSGGKHMSVLISDLLEYSRVSSQPKPLSPVAAADAVALALSNLQLDLERTGADVAVGELPRVMAEPTHLTSLFQNLLGNSLKYRSPDRPPRVSVTAERISSDQWRFAVTDNGIGIEAQYHAKIFEIFQRLDPASEAEGTGIGLTLCRRIVHRMGGTVWLTSEPGKGATFFFTLTDGGRDVPAGLAERRG
jgi:PAS domain S-box-containing protein